MKNLVLILLCFFWGYSISQNLISNPSFEDIDSCYGQPAGIGFDVFQWSGCMGWSNPIAASSDLWCENPVWGNLTPPNTGLIYQYSRTGENYAGILENDGIIINYREYLQNELLQELETNKYYTLSFYYSSLFVDCSINTFQALFSETQMDDSNALWLTHLIPSGSSDPTKYCTDTLGWNYGEITFKAKGGEKYMIFGNFQDTLTAAYSLPCDTSFWGNMSYAGNYFVFDDFNLEVTPIQLNIPNVFTPNGDGINDLYNPTVKGISGWKMILMNRWGNVMAELDEDNIHWDGGESPEGVYFYRFMDDSENLIEQGFFQLIR